MALSRKFLTALGIESEKIDQIIEAHTETTDALKEQRDKYKADAESLPAVQKELDDLKAAQKKDAETYKEKYEKEKADFDAFKTQQTEKEAKAKKTSAYRELLKEAGVSEKHINSVLKASAANADALEFDDDGKVKGSDKVIEAIQKDWDDMIVKTEKKGADVSNPPANDGGKNLTADEAYARARFERNYSAKYGKDPNANNDNGGKE